MKILSSEEIRKADAYTIEHEPVKSIDLMERAAKACAERLSRILMGKKETVYVFCGLGNNGGDGLAIARLLAKSPAHNLCAGQVEVFIIRYAGKCSEDFLVNEKRLKKIKGVKIHNITSTSDLPSSIIHHPSSIIIDALLGSGINKPAEGLAKEAIAFINQSGCPVISIDIPSGLFSEKNIHHKKNAIVKANHVLTFQTSKLAFMFAENRDYVQDFSVLDIGLNQEFIASLPSKNYFITKEDVQLILKHRNKFSHKGNFGHALIVSGSYGKMGAAVLASRSCLAAGAGLVTAHIPKCGYEILQTAVPEAMTIADEEEKFISSLSSLENFTAIGIGPGIGTEKQTQNVLKLLIQNSAAPLVLDADALNILSENKTWLAFLPKKSILTPHPGEFKRLVGNASPDYERYEMQKEFSVKHGVYLILKGAHTSVACPDGEVYFNSTGNPGMATAGSGDVLTGIITGLLAQGYDSKQASVLGVYLHGLAGDLAAEDMGQESLMARHLIEYLGEAYKRIKNYESFE